MTGQTIQLPTPTPPPPPAARPAWVRPVQVAAGVVAGGTVLLGALSVAAGLLVETDISTRAFTGPVTALQVEVDTGNVNIRTGDATSVTTRVHHAFYNPEPTAELVGGILKVEGNCSGGTFVIGTCDVDVDVVVPAGTEVVARSDTGDLEVIGVTGGVVAHTSTGDIDVQGIGGATLLTTNTGDINGEDLAGPSHARSDVGDLDLNFSAAPESLNASTNTGDVLVTVPNDGTRYQVTADSSGGDSKVQVPTDLDSTRHARLRSDIGDVTIRVAGRS